MANIEEAGEIYTPGSPEDLTQMLQNLNQFFTNKIKSIELYQQGQTMRPADETGSTRSVCHVDGVDDGDGGTAWGRVAEEQVS